MNVDRRKFSSVWLELPPPSHSSGIQPFADRELKVVLAGDSIAAGYGNSPYVTEGDSIDTCGRSQKYTPASRLSRASINFACKDASLKEIFEGRSDGETSQLEKIRKLGAAVDVMIFSGGINVMNLGKLMNGCRQGSCGIDETAASELQTIFGSDTFKNQLQDTYQRLRAAAPSATLVITGYAAPIKDEFPCNVLPVVGSSITTINHAIKELNHSIAQAVEDTHDNNAVYVAPPDSIGGCLASLRGDGGSFISPTDVRFGHLDKLGQTLEANKIAKEVAPYLKSKSGKL